MLPYGTYSVQEVKAPEQFQYLFNHEDIREIVFRGFEDDERVEFLEKLTNLYER